MTIHQDNHNTSLQNNHKKHFIAKLVVSALLALTLLAGILGVTSQTSHAATNQSYIVSIIQSTFGR